MRYAATLRYLGGDFCGFQVQPGKRTVQGEINRAANEVFEVPCSVTGCSRTDSGVHANGFVVLIEPHGESASVIPPEKLPLAMAAHLPPDLIVWRAVEAPDGFHPRYDVREKEYVYRIWNAPVRNPFWEGRAWHVPRCVDDAAIARIRAAAAHFVGRHDFRSLMADGSDVEDTVRTLFSCTCEKEGDLLLVRVCGDGFLYHMVRILTGTLLRVAEGKTAPEDIPAILEARDRNAAGMTAPACGLYLEEIRYPFPLF